MASVSTKFFLAIDGKPNTKLNEVRDKLIIMEWITTIGLTAAACTTASFLPQVIKTVKIKHTKDLSLGMYLILTVGIVLWLVYGILIEDSPLVIANAISLLFSGTILVYKIKYK